MRSDRIDTYTRILRMAADTDARRETKQRVSLDIPVGGVEVITRIKQRTGKDCLRCCVAMMIGLTYEEVPDFVAIYDKEWPSACEEWLSSRGMGLMMLGSPPKYIPHWLPVMAKGTTKRGPWHHCVVVTGDAVIDPHLEEDGLEEILEVYAIVHKPYQGNDRAQ